MKVIALIASSLLFAGCAHNAVPHDITEAAHISMANSFEVTVAPERCIEASHQPDPESELVALICLTSASDGSVGLVMNRQQWRAMVYLYQHGAN